MAGYLRAHNQVFDTDGNVCIVSGAEGLKIPSGKTKLAVGEVEKLTGVSPTTLRHYDKIGLLCPERTGDQAANNRKLYGVEDLERLQAILVLVEYQFSLSEIKTILNDDQVDIHCLIDQKLDNLRCQMNKLRSLTLFVKFIDLTDTDLIEGLGVGPTDIDDMANIARASRLYGVALEQLCSYTDEEATEIFAQIEDEISDLLALDEVKEFTEIEYLVDAFLTWWSDFVVPYESVGFLGFWAIFEDQSFVPEHVESIGGSGDASTVEMCIFFDMMAHLILEYGSLITAIARLAESDIVAALEKVQILRGAIVKAQLGTEIALSASENELKEVCTATLMYLKRVLDDDELIDFLDFFGMIDCNVEDVEKALKVFEIM